jgi:signal transduction histidine kinase
LLSARATLAIVTPWILLAWLAAVGPAPNGVLDVTTWAEPASLDGTWLFRAGDVPHGADATLDDHDWEPVITPQGLGSQGHRDLVGDFWLRLHVHGPSTLPIEQLAIQLQDLDSASEIFADGVWVGGRGSVHEPQAADEMHPGVWALPRDALDDGTVVIAIHGWRSPLRADARPDRGGIMHGPNRIGHTDTLVRSLIMRDLGAWVLVGSFVVVGLYHLQLFRRRRQLREYLWFGVFSLEIAAYVLTQIAIVGDYVPPSPKGWFFLVSVGVATFVEFLWTFLREPMAAGWRIWQTAIIAWALVAVAWPDAWLLSAYLVPWEFAAFVPFIIGASWLVVRRIRAGDPEARTIALGCVLMFATSVNNILRSLGLHAPELTNWAFAGLVIAMAASLSNRFMRVYGEVDALLAETLRLSKLKDEFLANTSHELRTPLNAILNIPRAVLDSVAAHPVLECSACDAIFEAEPSAPLGPVDEPCPACGAGALLVARRRMPPDDLDGLARHMDGIVRSGEHLLTVVDALLDASRLAAGGFELVRASVRIDDVVRLARDGVQALADERGVQLTTTADTTTVHGDRARLVQVLANLLRNAVTFSPTGATVEVEARGEGTTCVVHVVDHGPGIDPAHHSLVFEPFRQVDGGHTRAHGGTGLGLAIARQLVELHGGTLTVQSALGVGSTFTVRLPIAPAPADGTSGGKSGGTSPS